MNNILEATLQIKDAHNEGVTFHFLENIKEVLRDESGTEIVNSLEFDFVVPPPHS